MNPEGGGPCQGIRNSIPALQKLGVTNEVVSFDDPGADFLKHDSFKIHAIGQPKGPWLHQPELIPWLLENLPHYDAAIIHGLWLYHGYAVNKAMKALSGKNIRLPKVYVMPHGMLDPYFQKAPGRKLKALRNVLYWKFIESKVINNADGVLFTCQEELLLARQTFSPYRPKKELNVGYGIQAPPAYTTAMDDAFKAACPQLSGSYILFLSRIHDKKGVDILINAYIALNKDNKLPTLVIAGPGLDTPYGKEMAELAQGNTIIFAGMLTGNAKWGAFYGSEAFILPSHQENFGIAVVEAMACAKAVIISNQVNIWREIKEGNGGIVEDDTQQGANKMLKQWLNMSNEQKIEMGLNAQKIYETKFSSEKAAVQLLNRIK
ncbi:glycosyltransferase [Flavobacterium rivuli]|nr:glycosyltransferase [Flavobacterium rivuli]